MDYYTDEQWQAIQDREQYEAEMAACIESMESTGWSDEQERQMLADEIDAHEIDTPFAEALCPF